MSQTPHYPSLPMLCTSGTHYDVGYNVGLMFGEYIRRFWKESVDVNSILVPYIETTEGSRFYDVTLAVCKEAYPQYIREIEGLAAGAGMEFSQIFLLNLSKEITKVLADNKREENSQYASGCSDIFLNTPDCKLLAHNEDCDPLFKQYGYMVKARIVEDHQEVESFTAFCYAGILPGCTVAWNTHGLMFTCNGLYATYIVHGAPPRTFVSRSALKARDVHEAAELLKNPGYGLAYGFTVNIADVNNPSNMWSIELGPGRSETPMHLHRIPERAPQTGQPCYYMHFNSYKHLDVEDQNPPSSTARTHTAATLPEPTSLKKVLAVLGDRSDEKFPIFRLPSETDDSETIFTTVLDVFNRRVDFYQENPSVDGARHMSFSIGDH